MLNGIMAVGHNGSSNNNRLTTVNFLHDTAWVYYGASVQIWNYGIADRNRLTGDNGFQGLPSGYDDIINRYVGGVAMTVLPNAPIDPISKIAIPTIVAATQGGLSFLLDSYPQGPSKEIYDKTSTGPDGSRRTSITTTGCTGSRWT